MNTILPLNRLAEMLASRAGVDKAVAENFIIRFFETVENGLTAGETVSVKGFGTFRVKDEDVVFEPADEFAAAVNAPFEMFAPVEIGQDVDASALFAPIDKPAEEVPVTEETPSAVEEETSDVEEEPVVVVEPDEEDVSVVEDEPKPVEEDEQVIEEDEPTVDEPDEVAPEENNQEEISLTEPLETVEYDDEPRRRGVSRCCVALWLIVGLIVGMVIGIFGGYLGRDKIDMLLGRVSADASTMPNDTLKATEAEQPIDTMPVELTDSDIADINDPTTDPENVAKADPVKPAAPVEVYDTITSRRFLTTMARKYYGHQDYWVYIYKANSSKLRHPDQIRPGTRVLIPDFEKYRTSADPEQNRIDARREGVRIYDKYNKK